MTAAASNSRAVTADPAVHPASIKPLASAPDSPNAADDDSP
jgi:hypothetical protein